MDSNVSKAMGSSRRVAINIGGGFVPGLNAVIAGTVMAAHKLDWEVVGIRDGFDGLLFPYCYPDGGTVELTPKAIGEGISTGLRRCCLGHGHVY